MKLSLKSLFRSKDSSLLLLRFSSFSTVTMKQCLILCYLNCSALLWHRLMGRKVLSTSFSGTKKIRSYAHCSKQSVSYIPFILHLIFISGVIELSDLVTYFTLQKGITLLLINLDNSTTVHASVEFNRTWSLQHKHNVHRTKIIKLSEASMDGNEREEYHLTAKDGNLHSQTVLLNGNILSVNSAGDIPPLDPLHINSTNAISVGPFSIVFVHMPHVILPACSSNWSWFHSVNDQIRDGI